MTDKQTIDGVDVSGCEYYCERHCKQVVDEDGCYVFLCADDKDCYYKQLQAKEQECEKLKLDLIEAKAHGDYLNNLALSKTLDTVSAELNQFKQECERLKKKLNPKLKNAHCTYFEGQTGLCKAKEFTKCNPVNCKLYTIDELSTIVELQQQLDQLKADNEDLKGLNTRLDNQRETYWKEYQKLIATLAETREVLQFYNNTTIGTDKGNGFFEIEVPKGKFSKFIYYYDTNPAKEALQKISEVIND